MKTTLAAVLCCAILSGCVITKSEVREHNPEQAAQAFEMIKSLAGKWHGSMTEGNQQEKVDLTYEVVSGDSVVLERLFAGTPNEMVTMYHRDGDQLLMTHYCSMGNQPRMELAGFTAAPERTASFSFRDATNWKGPDASVMHDVRLCATGKDHLNASWTAWTKGKPDHTANFTFSRVP